MSQKRIRKRQGGLPELPYWRSILASFVLVLAMLFLFEAMADPRSAELRRPGVAAPVFGSFMLAGAAAFYAEFRLRRKRPREAARTERRAAMQEDPVWPKG